MGFAATPDGMLYLFGGYGGGNERGEWWGGGRRASVMCARAVPLLSLSSSIHKRKTSRDVYG
jgi:hypothetical protein